MGIYTIRTLLSAANLAVLVSGCNQNKTANIAFGSYEILEKEITFTLRKFLQRPSQTVRLPRPQAEGVNRTETPSRARENVVLQMRARVAPKTKVSQPLSQFDKKD
jgi:hypothetical protein